VVRYSNLTADRRSVTGAEKAGSVLHHFCKAKCGLTSARAKKDDGKNV
jgi:hypothetical protein